MMVVSDWALVPYARLRHRCVSGRQGYDSAGRPLLFHWPVYSTVDKAKCLIKSLKFVE